ncbi:mps one binder kinase activator-like 4 [Coprinopsis cinerea okayama7|uniref:Mps one binder kinase activator-like 4 n=1 Tax=Coprinopsis cinerea (strain Okayama-7 / 130 / ATCC MYA-4618 / FGSC 9003) TaxID=240176 RepID=A8P968_COPC7|nr:mps one binder kinase activator-like 4 [Coprinopsis cinerea okayama7\|eukprot:XP_001839709.1 mps one binder kinase activator-like 4 [Coprinopsis cinerea okayama7\
MTATIQRPLRGSRISTFYPVKNLPSLSSLDSAFQLQEYISLLIRLNVHDVEAITSLPGSTGSKESLNEADKKEAADGDKGVSVDQWCWVYEQLRRLAQDLTHPLITTLQQECTRATCPEMKAGEWLYLCVAHGNEGSMEQCCAVDYILHTLDSATALLNSPRAFPSRIQIPESSQRHFASLARRLGRIFAHAYFHHREAFEQAEAESSLYARFLALTSKFDLVPPEFLPIPPEAFYDQSELSRNAPPPKLGAANPDPQHPNGAANTEAERQHTQQQQLQDILQHPAPPTHDLEVPRNATSPPGLIPEAITSRPGRSRTDTMVFSEAAANSFAQQYARSEGEPAELALGESDVTDAQRASENAEPETAAPVSEEPPQEPAVVDLTEAEPEVPVQEESKAVESEAPPTDEAPAKSDETPVEDVPKDTIELLDEAEAKEQPSEPAPSESEAASETTVSKVEASPEPAEAPVEPPAPSEDSAPPPAAETADSSVKEEEKKEDAESSGTETPAEADAIEKKAEPDVEGDKDAQASNSSPEVPKEGSKEDSSS